MAMTDKELAAIEAQCRAVLRGDTEAGASAHEFAGDIVPLLLAENAKLRAEIGRLRGKTRRGSHDQA